ncbi:MAG: DUF4167 domain-containing protein [Rhodospirillales bacterium]|nr:DUF4167 domain-containing protein [Rhodospirillales bacterium]
MRPGPHMKRQRGRNNGRKPHMPQRTQTFDSSGPDVRIRGNAYQVLEKYLALARDATAAGDRIAAENFYQHAEHYYRVINANQDGHHRPPMNQQDQRMGQQGHYDGQQQQQPADPGGGPQPLPAGMQQGYQAGGEPRPQAPQNGGQNGGPQAAGQGGPYGADENSD